ncbi:MAG: TraB/GumN family protein [Pseudomonadota bacterium]
MDLIARYALLLLTCLSLSVPAAADTHPVSLWKAEGKTNVVYLLGSVHLLRRQDHPLPDVIEAAYDDADFLYMELDMDDLDPTLVQAASNRLGLIQGEDTLADLIGADRYAEASRLAAELDLPFEMLAKTEPWLAAVTLEQMVLLRIGFNPLYGIEMHMAMKSTQDGKPIEGLETIEEQLEFLDGLSLDAQTELLIQTLEEGAGIEATMDDLVRAWRHGDTDYLERAMLDEMAEYRELYETIVAERNRRWTDTIAGLMDDDRNYLVVVGALHLIGEDGVPALLSARGIDIGQMHESLR